MEVEIGHVLANYVFVNYPASLNMMSFLELRYGSRDWTYVLRGFIITFTNRISSMLIAV